MLAGLFSSYIRSFADLQRNIWVLSVSMLINRSGSMVLMFSSLYLTRDLHFSMETAGIILSFYGIGSVLGSYAGGWLTDRFHHYPIMMGSLIGSGLILFLLLWVESQIGISIVMFVYAFVADIFRPANSAAIGNFSTPENRTRSVSLVRLAVNLGFSVGPAAGGFIALALGFKTLFIIDAATSFGAAALLFFFLPRKAEVVHTKHQSEPIHKGKSAYQDWPYLFFVLLVAFYGISFFQLFASMPQFFKTVCHYQEDTIGLLLGLNGLLVVLIEMPLVAWLELRGRIFSLIIIGVLLVPLSFLFLEFGNGLLFFALVYTLVITLSEIFAMPFMMNYSISRGGQHRKGEYSALYSIGYGLANIAAPSLGLTIAAWYGFDSMFHFFIGLSLFTAAGFYLLGKRNEHQ
ncbi:MAG TPA: MFS transporter [Catalimonadaceae bacterium]|nr:MFS transporter [Catalimonadaceae bacterium]HPI10633.1 MFS transporter [Catalimonadaceae bacterium]